MSNGSVESIYGVAPLVSQEQRPRDATENEGTGILKKEEQFDPSRTGPRSCADLRTHARGPRSRSIRKSANNAEHDPAVRTGQSAGRANGLCSTGGNVRRCREFDTRASSVQQEGLDSLERTYSAHESHSLERLLIVLSSCILTSY